MSAPVAPVAVDVSVIVPTFNYGHLLPRALASIEAQTARPREIIVVDDGSTDDTLAVLAAWRGAIPVRVEQLARRGVSAVRNHGAALAQGRYLGLLDADDAWWPEKLARQLAVFEEDPGLGAVGCANEVRDATGALLRVRYFPNPADDRVARLRGLLVREPWLGSSNSGALIPRAIFDELGGFDEGLRAAEDWDLWLRIGARYRMRNVHAILVTIYFHRTGMFRDAALMETTQRRVLAKAVAAWPEVIDAAMQAQLEAMIVRDAAAETDRSGRLAPVLRRHWQVVRQAPTAWTSWRGLVTSAVTGLRRTRGVSPPR